MVAPLGPPSSLPIPAFLQTDFILTTNQGRNRLVRRSFEHFGYRVTFLKRLQIATIDLKGMAFGDLISLSKHEIKSLRSNLNILR